jgi:hypothetical protein
MSTVPEKFSVSIFIVLSLLLLDVQTKQQSETTAAEASVQLQSGHINDVTSFTSEKPTTMHKTEIYKPQAGMLTQNYIR